jgi:hypothetical protein
MITIKVTNGKTFKYEGKVELLLREYIRYTDLLKRATEMFNDGLISTIELSICRRRTREKREQLSNTEEELPELFTPFSSLNSPSVTFTESDGSIIFQYKSELDSIAEQIDKEVKLLMLNLK